MTLLVRPMARHLRHLRRSRPIDLKDRISTLKKIDREGRKAKRPMKPRPAPAPKVRPHARAPCGGAQDRASPNFMGRASLGQDRYFLSYPI